MAAISNNGTEKMAAQIDEIYQKLSIIESFLDDMRPGIEKITKEINPTVRGLRERFERDETLQLVNRTGDNIPNFIDLIDMMTAMKGMMDDYQPAIEKIMKELHPTIRVMREKFERDETLQLVKRTGDNIPNFIDLIDMMTAMKGMMDDYQPSIEKIMKELHPTIRVMREKFERDETLQLVKRTGDNIPNFIDLIDMMTAMKGMMDDYQPSIEKIVKELHPTIRALRESFEKDVTLDVMKKTGDNMEVFDRMLDFLKGFDESGLLQFTLDTQSDSDVRHLLRSAQVCMLKSIKEIREKPPAPGIGKLMSAMMDPEVQKGMLIMTTFAKNLSHCVMSPPEK
jgi:uncharacterized protein YjgD (DUF1641 family)